MNYTVDINCDVGEGMGNEPALMPYISSCNIACGGHAGTERIMKEIILLALQNRVKIGAHPSYPDKKNFGREIMHISNPDLQQSIENQINTFKSVLQDAGGELHHIKAHGALYNLAAIEPKTAQLIINAVKNTASNAFLYVPYQSVIQELALQQGQKIKIEAFADRNYNADLSLVSRKQPNALITDPNLLILHLLNMITRKKVLTIDRVEVDLGADTFCVHGDNLNAEKLVKYISEKLEENGIKVA